MSPTAFSIGSSDFNTGKQYLKNMVASSAIMTNKPGTPQAIGQIRIAELKLVSKS
jgi:hypothetical protein